MNEGNEQEGLYYSAEPSDKTAFTERNDRVYTAIARLYSIFVRFGPLWKTWLETALPHIRGPRVLEVSFGTGYLLTQLYSAQQARHPQCDYEIHGVEWNEKLLQMALQTLLEQQKEKQVGDEKAPASLPRLVRANVEDLPYPDEYFDSVLVTMAFTGYPDGDRAMAELRRVLKTDGKLVMVDINYPKDRGNCLGMTLTRLWRAAGDLIRDMDALFQEFGFVFTDEEVGGFGSVHLYIATK